MNIVAETSPHGLLTLWCFASEWWPCWSLHLDDYSQISYRNSEKHFVEICCLELQSNTSLKFSANWFNFRGASNLLFPLFLIKNDMEILDLNFCCSLFFWCLSWHAWWIAAYGARFPCVISHYLKTTMIHTWLMCVTCLSFLFSLFFCLNSLSSLPHRVATDVSIFVDAQLASIFSSSLFFFCIMIVLL